MPNYELYEDAQLVNYSFLPLVNIHQKKKKKKNEDRSEKSG